jgi:hypothetical protein
LLPAAAGAATIRLPLEYAAPVWAPAPEPTGTYETPRIAGLRTLGAPGTPALPVHTVALLLPPGEEIAAVRATASGTPHVTRHRVAPAQGEHPLSHDSPRRWIAPRDEIYAADEIFPREAARWLTTQIYRGHRIAVVAVYPLRVRPASRACELSASLTLEVTTRPRPAGAKAPATYRDDAATHRWLARRIANPEMLAAYASAPPPKAAVAGLADPGDTHRYVIITSATMANAYQALADDRTAKGLSAIVVDKNEILATYPGRDAAEQVRNFILDAYLNWETEYVLLGGDVQIVPYRGCYCRIADDVSAYETNDLNCDLYYGGLDGDWNADDDHRWGEPGEADLIPEVHVGRSCTDNSTEAWGFVRKVLRYENAPVAGEIETAAFFGELLWPSTWGGQYMEEVRLGSDAHGFVTAGLPADWSMVTHYELDGGWVRQTYIDRMNGGTHMFHHMGHSNYDYNAKMTSVHAPEFLSDGVTHTHHVGYTQGCNCGGFDAADAVLEELITSSTGYVALIGNTRYGFGEVGSTNGSSQYYHRQFVDALWGEGVTILGEAHNDTRADNLGYIDFSANRWVHYELTILGDPAMPIWTCAPRTPVLEHAGALVLGESAYPLRITAEGAPVAGARIGAWNEAGTLYAAALTDAAGEAALPLAPQATGWLHLVVSGANLRVTETVIPIVPNEPYIAVRSRTLDDSAGGDGDGCCQFGEVCALDVELHNTWNKPITDVSAVLRCNHPDVTLLDSLVAYGTLAAGSAGSGLAGDRFDFAIGGGCPDEAVLAFELQVAGGGRTLWTHDFAYDVAAPALQIVALHFDDQLGGDGDQSLEPGESARVTIQLANRGHAPALAVGACLTATGRDLVITQPESLAGDLPPGSCALLTPPIELQLAADAAVPERISCALAVSGEQTLAVAIPLELPVGGFRDQIETGDDRWGHAALAVGFSDQWRLSTTRNHTPGGAQCWKFGGSGTQDYGNSGGGALVSEPVAVGRHVELAFWHWIEAEVSIGFPGACYDGGRVELSVDGGDWTALTPAGGYPYLIRHGMNPAPFPADTPVFSGTHEWTPARFAFTTDGGSAEIRFCFGSDGIVTAEGWYIDDVTLCTWDASPAGAPVQSLTLHPSLGPSRPNPFHAETRVDLSLPSRSRVRLLVLDAQGRLVRTLIASMLPAGVHRIAWNGEDQRGRAAAAGVYFYRLECGEQRLTRKATLLR